MQYELKLSILKFRVQTMSKPQQERQPFSFIKKLHQDKPALAKKLSLIGGTGSIVANSCMLAAPLYGAGLLKIFGKSKVADQSIINMANYWIHSNNFMIDKILPQKDWHITLPSNLKKDGKYLLICNHQSWVDTSVIQYISEGRLPITRFFAKHELLYIPIVGQTFYFLDFPMMKRHSKSAISKNPTLATRDLEEARRACNLLSDKPFVLLNYLEGTRFTKQKHTAQQSPYKHLLKPKAGGLALAIASLGDKIDGILDMTIVYPNGIPTYAELWEGKIDKLAVDIRPLDINPELFHALQQGKYDSDEVIKHEFYQFLDKTWQQKDKLIDELYAKF